MQCPFLGLGETLFKVPFSCELYHMPFLGLGKTRLKRKEPITYSHSIIKNIDLKREPKPKVGWYLILIIWAVPFALEHFTHLE